MKAIHRAGTLATALALAVGVAGTSASPTEARDNLPGDNGARCAYYNQETGELEFYLPGQFVELTDSEGRSHILICGNDGNWVDMNPGGARGATRKNGR
jgi:hypothetical protein